MPIIGRPVSQTAPDYIEPLVGVRGWDAEDDLLVSPTMERPWNTIEQAECHIRSTAPASSHQAPGAGCRCGLYAFYRPDQLYEHYPTVPITGLVQMWGECRVHQDGIRSEWMKICALVEPTAPKERYDTARAWFKKWIRGGIVSVLSTALVGFIPYMVGIIDPTDSAQYLGLVLFLTVFMFGVWASVFCTLLIGWVLPARRAYYRQPDIQRIARRYGVPVIPFKDVPDTLARMGTMIVHDTAARPHITSDPTPMPIPTKAHL